MAEIADCVLDHHSKWFEGPYGCVLAAGARPALQRSVEAGRHADRVGKIQPEGAHRKARVVPPVLASARAARASAERMVVIPTDTAVSLHSATAALCIGLYSAPRSSVNHPYRLTPAEAAE